MKKSITLNGRTVCYELTVKSVKNINLRIRTDGSISVSANRRVPQSEIDRFLQVKADSILKSLDRITDQRRNRLFPEKYITGEKILILGKVYELTVRKSTVNAVQITDDRLTVNVKKPDDAALTANIIDKWLRQYGRQVITSVCTGLYPFFREQGVSFPTIRFRKMVSQWGNCRPREGVLTFNVSLVMAPIQCIEYVVAHEFTHFLHPDHSKAFYKRLSDCMPDWAYRKKMLTDTPIIPA